MPQRLREPLVKIESVPLMAQRWVWGCVPGPLPYRVSVIMPDGAGIEALRKLQNPVTLKMDIDGDIGLNDARFEGEWKRLYLTEPRRVDAFTWSFELADQRVRWHGKRFTWTSNRTWRLNEFGEGVPRQIDPNDPGALRQPFDRYAEFRYLPWSKNGNAPWTARELLLRVLNELEGGTNRLVEGQDNGVVVERQEWLEEPVERVIAELCNLSRSAVGVLPDGRVHVYRTEEIIDANAVMPMSRPPIDGGRIFMQDLSRVRPAEVKVRAAKRVETLIVAVTAQPGSSAPAASGSPVIGPTRSAIPDEGRCEITEQDYETGRAVACYNVVKLPRDITVGVTTYQRDTWVPMGVFLQAIGISESDVRDQWFSKIFVFEHAVVNAGRGIADPPDPVRMMEALAILQHYRQSWQIDPYWVQRWESWDTTRASLIDPVTRYALPTPVWSDFCVVPSVFLPAHAKAKRAYRKRAWNYLLDEEPPDGDGAKIDRTQTYTASALEVQDAQLGVFRVAYPQDLEAVVQEIVPSGVDNLPVISAGGDVLLWQDASLRQIHRMEAVVSVTPAVDATGRPSDRRLLEISMPVRNGQGPPQELLITEEVARYPHPAGLVGEDSEKARQAAEAQLPSNIGLLVNLAQTKANILQHSYVDRLSGYASFPGADAKKLKLFGPCRGIYVEFDESGGLRSHYDCTSPPPIPELITRLSPAERRYLYRQLEANA